jgi:acyl carrier protein
MVSEKAVLVTIKEALEIEADHVTIDSSMEDLEEWDSIGHLSILANIDSLLDGKAAGIQELATADSVRKILKSLKENSLIDC